MKTYAKVALTLTVFATVTNLAFASGSAFTPLNFEDSNSYSAPKAVPAKTTSTNPITNAFSKVMPSKEQPVADASASGEIPIGNDNIQNAILELDNAQVGIRNDLLNYKAKYADVDAQYKLIKNERAILKRQVRSIERRIKSIDRAKEKIRRNIYIVGSQEMLY